MNQEQIRALFRLYVETGTVLETWPMGEDLELHALTFRYHHSLAKRLAALGVIPDTKSLGFD